MKTLFSVFLSVFFLVSCGKDNNTGGIAGIVNQLQTDANGYYTGTSQEILNSLRVAFEAKTINEGVQVSSSYNASVGTFDVNYGGMGYSYNLEDQANITFLIRSQNNQAINFDKIIQPNGGSTTYGSGAYTATDKTSLLNSVFKTVSNSVQLIGISPFNLRMGNTGTTISAYEIRYQVMVNNRATPMTYVVSPDVALFYNPLYAEEIVDNGQYRSVNSIGNQPLYNN